MRSVLPRDRAGRAGKESERDVLAFDSRLINNPPPPLSGGLKHSRMQGKRILLVDDEALVGQSVSLLLQLDGHTVDYVGNGRAALEQYAPGKYDLVLTDSRMPEMGGVELATQIRLLHPTQRIMMLTGFPPSHPVPALDLIVLKPFSGSELRNAVTKLTELTPTKP